MTKPDASTPAPLRLAVLISGGGTTLVNLQSRIAAGTLAAEVITVVANRQCRGVERATGLGIEAKVTLRSSFASLGAFSDHLFDKFREQKIDLVVLGGFLAKILIPHDFEGRVVNIHPALIPAFSGQGMYGHHVHEAVLARGCKVSGCTVHFCDNDYDHGPIILQRVVPVLDGDNADDIAARVFDAECEAYPDAINLIAAGRLQIRDGRVHIRE